MSGTAASALVPSASVRLIDAKGNMVGVVSSREGLKLAEADFKRGLLNDERMHRIRDAVAEIVDDLNAHEDNVEPIEQGCIDPEGESPLALLDKAEGVRAMAVPDRWRDGHPVLCIPGRGLLDEAAAILVAQLVERRGIGARAEQPEALFNGFTPPFPNLVMGAVEVFTIT